MSATNTTNLKHVRPRGSFNGKGAHRRTSKLSAVASFVACVFCLTNSLNAAPAVAETLSRFKPTHADVDYDQPTAQQAAQSQLKSVREANASGWVVTDVNNQILRKFFDTNGDTKVDRWSYFKAGVEVYRDIDSNFDGRADQFRWLGAAGIRWGVDSDADGTIDYWKVISAQEVSQELIAAMQSRDQARFARLFASDREIQGLGVSPELQQKLSDGRARAVQVFAASAAASSLLEKNAHWVHFGGTHGVLPSGSDGRTQDLYVYDNVIAVIEHEKVHRQILVGALLRSGDTWRLVQLPPVLSTAGNGTADNQVAQYEGYFFSSSNAATASSNQGGTAEMSAEIQQLLAQLEEIDVQLASVASADAGQSLNKQRADVLVQLISKSSSVEEKSNWIRQFADSVSAAVQSGAYPQGIAQLQALDSQVAQAGGADHAYVQFRLMTARYGDSLRRSPEKFDAVQGKWLVDLDTFVKKFPASGDAPEAIFQLAIAEEFSGSFDRAIAYYGEIVSKYPKAPIVPKAEGAQRRLNLKGKPLALVSKSLGGQQIDTRRFSGRIVVIHYWASWSDPSTQDMALLKRLASKYGDKLALVGVNLDADPDAAVQLVQNSDFSWPHLYSAGGMDSSLANQLGIVSVPMIFLVGADGKVVKTSVHSAELDALIAELLE
ncbi:MAG: redoxin family protein [Planctomycetaceae bacterium]|jgi:thiol-disulfide isomerase/thioredoxin|nr:redoxin family protein [Planctomycetaceae bacterium]MBT4726706.1 redoxin family protein [Planctomycetaceae bacterium]MBT5885337.1 redoxin family protein [Planctomycetaceae bacterium]MBT6847412.1 redoxin family protein [Planctomycetaceae bacterium]MBT7255180.1 redoxin family protein [Planctomycetaceae bacterium]